MIKFFSYHSNGVFMTTEERMVFVGEKEKKLINSYLSKALIIAEEKEELR